MVVLIERRAVFVRGWDTLVSESELVARLFSVPLEIVSGRKVEQQCFCLTGDVQGRIGFARNGQCFE